MNFTPPHNFRFNVSLRNINFRMSSHAHSPLRPLPCFFNTLDYRFSAYFNLITIFFMLETNLTFNVSPDW